jgi:hypothetical protein
MFFLRKKKLIVDAFTSSPNAHRFFPIQKAHKFMPSWWKNMNNSFSHKTDIGLTIQRPTIKRCEGLMSLYQEGFVIPLWSDVVIETANNSVKYAFADDTSQIGNHTAEQMTAEFQNYIHAKFISPWRLTEKSGLKFLFLQPSWNQINFLFEMHVVPGVVDYKYQHTSNINVLMARNKRFSLAAGEALAHIIPISEHDIDIRTHLVDENELKKMPEGSNAFPFFLGSYRKAKKIITNED